jgi:PAS domain-containing protein
LQISEGKQRLERILASIQDAFISLDARLRYTFANNNAAVLLGVKKEGTHWSTASSWRPCTRSQTHVVFLLRRVGPAMIGQSVWRFMVDDEEGTMRLNLEKAVKDKIDVGFEFYYSALDRWYAPDRAPIDVVSSASGM